MSGAVGAVATVLVAASDRERLPDLLAAGARAPAFAAMPVEALAHRQLAPRCVMVGYWEDSGDPFPDFMIVNDTDLGDTYAWLSAYAAGLAPITQWCRLWTRTQIDDLRNVPARASLGSRLGPWVGAIVAECATQARTPINLRSLSGMLALSSASFAAARAQAVWGGFAHFAELGRRHDELSERLRERIRPISAGRLAGLWYALAGDGWTGRPPADDRPLTIFRDLFDLTLPEDLPAAERADAMIGLVTDVFDLPDLAACATGPQRDRVDALDRLGARLAEGPKSAAIDAVLGFGASLVEPGAAVMPDLLGRFEAGMPTAAIWAGAFAGLWAPVRVLSDHNGLGRLIAKALLKDGDLRSKPAADIGYDELIRLLPGSPGGRTPVVRGMAARIVEVELFPGVTAPFQLRPEPAPVTRSAPRQRPLDLAAPDAPKAAALPGLSDFLTMIEELRHRIGVLEADRSGSARNRRPGATRKGKA